MLPRDKPTLKPTYHVWPPVKINVRPAAHSRRLASYDLGQRSELLKEWKRRQSLLAAVVDVDRRNPPSPEIDGPGKDEIGVALHLPASHLLVGERIVGRLLRGTPVEVDHA